jgi:DnaJ-class molecular chaperone
MIKRIEDWNCYELLNVERTASQDEIWEAYQAALATYQPGSLAVYSLVTEDERTLILERIREAFQILRDPKTRKDYDLSLLKHKPYYAPKATFRKSVGKMEIEEAPAKRSLWARFKRIFSRRRDVVDLAPPDDQ